MICISSSFRARVIASVSMVLFLVAAGCSDSSGPKTTVTGNWTGSAPISVGSNATLSMVLTESSGAVTGTGSLVGSTSIALTVTGTYAAPSLGLTMSAPGFSSLNLTATVSGKTMTGTLNGSGFNNTAITLTKP